MVVIMVSMPRDFVARSTSLRAFVMPQGQVFAYAGVFLFIVGLLSVVGLIPLGRFFTWM